MTSLLGTDTAALPWGRALAGEGYAPGRAATERRAENHGLDTNEATLVFETRTSGEGSGT